MTFAFIEQHAGTWPVRLMCRVLAVSPSGYYDWRSRPESARSASDRQLLADVQRIHAGHHRRYGSPRVHAALQAEGRTASRGRVERLMHRHGIRALAGRRFRPCTTDSRHDLPIAPNLLKQQFSAALPNTVWLADITYLPTGEGWLYLAAVLDLATRKIVGWSMRDHMRTELTSAALMMATQRQRPAIGLICHSDRGSQYAGRAYQALLAAHGLTGSMSRRGDCWDNAVAESFFATIKGEMTVHEVIEEEIFYPAVKRKADEEGKELVAEAVEEHHVIDVLIKEMKAMRSIDEQYKAKFTVLQENVEHHVEEEEGEMFPDAKKLLGDDIEKLAERMDKRKQELMAAVS